MSSTNVAVIRRFASLEHNPRVREYFRDIDDFEAQEMFVVKALLRQGCLVDDQDTLDIIHFKMWLFNEYINQEGLDVYGIPIARFHSESNEFKPQVMLYFQGRKEDEDGDTGILSAEISFRLFWEEGQVTKPRLQALAREVKQKIATPPFQWRKGTEIVTYYKPSDGFELRLYVASKAEGIRVVKKVVEVAGKTFDEECISHSQSDRRFPVNPGTEIVLGEQRKKRRRRPIGEVTFEYAQLIWHKLTKPIILVNSGYRFRRAVEYANS